MFVEVLFVFFALLSYYYITKEPNIVPTTKPLKIAFGCQKRVGKDTACGYLVSKYGGKHLSFAKPLYDILMYACEKTGFEYEKDREFLIWVGTEWARKKDKDVWVNMALNSVKTKYSGQNVFFSDLRFSNEFERLRQEGFVLVKITRDGVDDDGIGNNHISEKDLSHRKDWDYVIENNDTVEEFCKKLDIMVNKILLL